ncbi:hypothetical protein L207DRAFT_310344 [Hyaloscypha variabilis F]|uniref:Uncharacterized protein n=1 Tax=Hyaloscypha variabilis (strain UAMH 11265 / GT02V1 / F) TaxID=1149755 RepID=A0A2J6RV38_HYAVF|nr:hypothetical protein L207DRAFT_310344 [Hyaloscypha variabilis F]
MDGVARNNSPWRLIQANEQIAEEEKDPFFTLLEQMAESEHWRGGPTEFDFLLDGGLELGTPASLTLRPNIASSLDFMDTWASYISPSIAPEEADWLQLASDQAASSSYEPWQDPQRKSMRPFLSAHQRSDLNIHGFSGIAYDESTPRPRIDSSIPTSADDVLAAATLLKNGLPGRGVSVHNGTFLLNIPKFSDPATYEVGPQASAQEVPSVYPDLRNMVWPIDVDAIAAEGPQEWKWLTMNL